jgi:hypothetical protein
VSRRGARDDSGRACPNRRGGPRRRRTRLPEPRDRSPSKGTAPAVDAGRAPSAAIALPVTPAPSAVAPDPLAVRPTRVAVDAPCLPRRPSSGCDEPQPCRRCGETSRRDGGGGRRDRETRRHHGESSRDHRESSRHHGESSLRHGESSLHHGETAPRDRETRRRHGETAPRDPKTIPRDHKTAPRHRATVPRDPRTTPRDRKTDPRPRETTRVERRRRANEPPRVRLYPHALARPAGPPTSDSRALSPWRRGAVASWRSLLAVERPLLADELPR